MTPPSILRHITPWWLLRWIDDRFNYCWPDIVAWKLGRNSDGWKKIDRKCFVRVKEGSRSVFDAFEACWCGKYPKGVKHVDHKKEAYFIHGRPEG